MTDAEGTTCAAYMIYIDKCKKRKSLEKAVSLNRCIKPSSPYGTSWGQPSRAGEMARPWNF